MPLNTPSNPPLYCVGGMGRDHHRPGGDGRGPIRPDIVRGGDGRGDGRGE